MEHTAEACLDTPKRRIVLIDNFRGLALVYMAVFHFLFDMAFVVPTDWGKAAYYANEKIVVFDTASFILLAGVSSALSRSNLRRGGRLLAIALAFTLVTAFVFPGEAIYFGILHLLGLSMVLFGAFEDRLKKLPALPMLAACAVIFALTYEISSGFVGIKGLFELPVPAELLQNNLLYPLGFIKAGFASVDYVPLLPWFFLYFGGAYIGALVVRRRDRLPSFCYADPVPWLSFIGRHTLLIYILHQPVILAAVYAAVFLMNLGR